MKFQDESQTGMKIDGRNINNLRYAYDPTLMVKVEEELKRVLMRMKSVQFSQLMFYVPFNVH